MPRARTHALAPSAPLSRAAIDRATRHDRRWPRGADICMLGCLAAGETLSGWLLPRGWTILWFSPLFLLGLLLLLLRLLVAGPAATLIDARTQLRSMLTGEGAAASVWIAVSSRLAGLIVGALAVLLIGYTPRPEQPRVSPHVLLDLPTRHDAGWYLSIARLGYTPHGARSAAERRVAFFPLYPVLMRAAGDLVTLPAKLLRWRGFLGGGDARVLWGGLLVSFACFVLALHRMYALARLDGLTHAHAVRALALLACYPFALFFGAAYSEALCLLTLAGAVLAWRRGQLLEAGLWGIACGLARSNGFTLSLALLFDLAISRRTRDRRLPRLLTALCPIFGMLAFSAYVGHVTGHPFQWVAAQAAWGRQFAPAAFVARRMDDVRALGWEYVTAQPLEALTIACLAVIAAGAMLAAWRRQWLYAAIVAAYLTPAILIDLPAIGRLTCVLFPVFLTLAPALGRVSAITLLVLFSAAQGWLATQYFRWLPPF